MTYSEQQFGILFQQNYSRLLGLAVSMLGDAEEARDVVSSVFARLWHQNVKGGLMMPLGNQSSPFLYTVVKRACIDQLRRRRFRKQAERHLIDSDVVESDELELKEQKHLLETLMHTRLTRQDRRVLSLVYHEEQTYKEAARQLGISPSAVNKHVTQALKKLRRWAVIILLIATAAAAAIIGVRVVRHAAMKSSPTVPSSSLQPVPPTSSDFLLAVPDTINAETVTSETSPLSKENVDTLREKTYKEQVSMMPDTTRVIFNGRTDDAAYSRDFVLNYLDETDIVGIETRTDGTLNVNTLNKNVIRVETNPRSETWESNMPLPTFSRRVVVSGHVRGGRYYSGNQLNAARIMVNYRGTTDTVFTNGYGAFSYSVPKGAKLTFSYPGERPKSIRVRRNREQLDIQLKDRRGISPHALPIHLKRTRTALRFNDADSVYLDGICVAADVLDSLPSYAIKSVEYSSFLTSRRYSGVDGMMQIRGRVTDSKGRPLPGASVMLTAGGLEHAYGVFTNADGCFTMSVCPFTRLRVQYPGYYPCELRVRTATEQVKVPEEKGERTKHKPLRQAYETRLDDMDIRMVRVPAGVTLVGYQ